MLGEAIGGRGEVRRMRNGFRDLAFARGVSGFGFGFGGFGGAAAHCGSLAKVVSVSVLNGCGNRCEGWC